MDVRISPSLMCADLMRLADEIEALEPIADEFHVDILDWHYCRNLCLAPVFVEGVTKVTALPVEAHLYVDNIELDLVELCMDCGASIITMPPEVIERQAWTIRRATEERHVGFGIFCNPATPLSVALPYAEALDRLLLMTVDPGFAGQELIPSVVDKVAEAAALRERTGAHFDIEVDGNCNERWWRRLADAGADTFVLGGSGLFSRSDDTSQAARLTQELLDTELGR